MLQEIRRICQVPELKAKIIFTLLMLVACRIGAFIPVPGINAEIAVSYFRHAAGGGQNFFQMVDIFSGGAFSQMTVIALGVVPYISASIILQLLVALWPSFQREMHENQEQGKRKLTKLTRLLTVVLSFLQSGLFAKYALRMNMSSPGIISGELLDIQIGNTPWLFYILFMFTMTTGTVLLMWMGEQMTEKGIGNGMSLIIMLGILASLPTALGMIFQQLNLSSQEPGQMSFTGVLVLLTLFVLIALATILIIQGHRRIPLQYARRVVGRKEVQGGNSYIPLKVNYAGVIPVIFASSLLMFPATLAGFAGGTWFGELASSLQPGSNIYLLFYVFLIVFFTYFWTATQFKPDQIASDMKKNGAFVPGIRQGKPTQDFLETTMGRITFIGAFLLALIAILPNLVGRFLGISQTISYFFGGTALLILVGVVLDTMKQVDSHLLMKRYDGFMKQGRSRGK
ncbi:MAG: preprotein translocase subunit SecY [Parachlamydiaceae bacterium]|nr:preprotein translocase subunit SecY [Parachlamydiaceae bacterium]